MKVRLISDLYEIEGYDPKEILNELYEYLDDESKIQFAYQIQKYYNLDIDKMTMDEAIKQKIVSPEQILDEATQYFSDFIQRDFINYFYQDN